jgi:hypothetical protein
VFSEEDRQGKEGREAENPGDNAEDRVPT